jgi:hypothetical protein
MIVKADGSIEGAGLDPTKDLKLKKQVRKYAAGFMDKLEAGEVPAPGPGDCWYCGLRKPSGASMGEEMDTLHSDGSMTVERNTDHILSHIGLGEPVEEREVYYVPSLLQRALEVGDASKSMWWWLGAFWSDRPEDKKLEARTWNERKRVEKALYKYVCRQLGLAV